MRALAVGLVALALLSGDAGAAGDPERGRTLFVEGCSSCHGLDARGVEEVAPSLEGVGAGAADFYLTTGRMPLADPGVPPERTEPEYSPAEIDDLVAYIGSLGEGGVPLLDPDPARGDLAEGREAFTASCAGCHQVLGAGGIAADVVAPPLHEATPRQIAEAIRVGPYAMPRFGQAEIDDHTLDSIVRYVLYAREPEDEGGWALGHVGPIPEGLVAWLLAGVTLILVCRLLQGRAR
jgi:ubiquinol-cytochrome c reductase cytochrome c subunit